jgi:2-amino-4-hydroxy-6-hydroxymethyldihydropteridine diphosphokinase
MPEPVIAYVALGSNLGDRQRLLDEAIARLRLQPGVEVARVSTYYDTDPVGGPAGQGRYLNAVAEVRSTLDAARLLRVLLSIETQLGRVRAERFGPRTIDLDLLLYGSAIVHIQEADCDLTVPHPRMHERAFVLEPLVEVAPLAVHPVLQSTAKDLLDRLRTQDRPRAGRRELAGQTAVVTGATSGIGRAIALGLADAGANIVVHGRRAEAAETVVQECRQKQVQAKSIVLDLHETHGCDKLVDVAWEGGKQPIDIWINNAGADTLTGEAAKWPFLRKLQELWEVDVRATMQISRSVGARMKQQGRGVIVNIGWDQAETGMEGDSGQLFGACKGAVMAFTKSLALSLAPQVRVNCLAPGWIRTAWGNQASAAWQERVLKETPLQRWGTPEDVAGAAVWLVSPAATFITGQIIRVNGGAVRG